MGPTLNATPRRQSCDRCHIQKLRCSRSDNGKTGVCDRCLRKGIPCSYSSSLPKGRPSLYCLNEVPVESKVPGKTLRASSTSPATTPATSATTAIPLIVSDIQITHITHGDTMPSSQVAAADVDADAGVDAGADAHADADVVAGADVDMAVEISTSLSANTDLNGAEAFVLPCSMEMFTDLQASWRLPENLIGDNMLDMSLDSRFDWDPTMEAQFQASSEFSGPFPGGLRGAFTGNKGDAGPGYPRENGLGLEADFAEDSSMSSSNSYSGVVFAADNNGYELSITYLSRLSMRLSQLLLSSCFQAETWDPPRNDSGQSGRGSHF